MPMPAGETMGKQQSANFTYPRFLTSALRRCCWPEPALTGSYGTLE